MRDDRLHGIGDVPFLYDKVGTREESRHSPAQQQRTKNAVDDQTYLEGADTEKVACLILKFITDSLDNECEQYQQPHPIGTAETRAVKQRK